MRHKAKPAPETFSWKEYRGLDATKLVMRPDALNVLRAPSRIGTSLVPYKLVFDEVKK